MKSLKFPDIFNLNSTNVSTDFEATKQNLGLLLRSEKGELFGDPFFGLRLKRYLFNQNDLILRDILADEIYTQLALFMPQLIVKREDIKIIPSRSKIYCKFEAMNQANFTTDMYQLVLYDDQEQGAI